MKTKDKHSRIFHSAGKSLLSLLVLFALTILFPAQALAWWDVPTSGTGTGSSLRDFLLGDVNVNHKGPGSNIPRWACGTGSIDNFSFKNWKELRGNGNLLYGWECEGSLVFMGCRSSTSGQNCIGNTVIKAPASAGKRPDAQTGYTTWQVRAYDIYASDPGFAGHIYIGTKDSPIDLQSGGDLLIWPGSSGNWKVYHYGGLRNTATHKSIYVKNYNLVSPLDVAPPWTLHNVANASSTISNRYFTGNAGTFIQGARDVDIDGSSQIGSRELPARVFTDSWERKVTPKDSTNVIGNVWSRWNYNDGLLTQNGAYVTGICFPYNSARASCYDPLKNKQRSPSTAFGPTTLYGNLISIGGSFLTNASTTNQDALSYASIPDGASIKFARLYWQGHLKGNAKLSWERNPFIRSMGISDYGSGENLIRPTREREPMDITLRLGFRYPSLYNYSAINNYAIRSNPELFNWAYTSPASSTSSWSVQYQGVADVTELLKQLYANSPKGNQELAAGVSAFNISLNTDISGSLNTGTASSGGWALFIVYEYPNAQDQKANIGKAKMITVVDGFNHMESSKPSATKPFTYTAFPHVFAGFVNGDFADNFSGKLHTFVINDGLYGDTKFSFAGEDLKVGDKTDIFSGVSGFRYNQPAIEIGHKLGYGWQTPNVTTSVGGSRNIFASVLALDIIQGDPELCVQSISYVNAQGQTSPLYIGENLTAKVTLNNRGNAGLRNLQLWSNFTSTYTRISDLHTLVNGTFRRGEAISEVPIPFTAKSTTTPGSYDLFTSIRAAYSGPYRTLFTTTSTHTLPMCSGGAFPKVTLEQNKKPVAKVTEMSGSWASDKLQTKAIGTTMQFKLIMSADDGKTLTADKIKALVLQQNNRADTGGEEWRDIQTPIAQSTDVPAAGLSFTVSQPMDGTKPRAYRQLRFKITQPDDSVTYSDLFALRPNHFRLVSYSDREKNWAQAIKTRTNESFQVDIRANGKNDRVTYQEISGYEVQIGATGPVSLSTSTGKATCALGALKDGSTTGFSTKSFGSNGQITYSGLTYDETGPLVVTAKETIGSEWAKVDTNDTAESERLIAEGSTTLTFSPARFIATNPFVSSQGTDTETFAYFGVSVADGAELTYDVVATSDLQGKEGVKNFDPACDATDVRVTQALTKEDTLHKGKVKVQFEGGTPNSFDGLSLPSISLKASEFSQGSAQASSKFTFLVDSRQTPLNPLPIMGNGQSVTLTFTDANGSQSTSEIDSHKFAFLFGRIYVTDVEAFKGAAEAHGTLYYEAYCLEGGCSDYKIGDPSVSMTDGWYRLKDYNNPIFKLTNIEPAAYRPTELNQYNRGETNLQTFSGFSKMPINLQKTLQIKHGTGSSEFPEYLLYNPGFDEKVTRFYIEITDRPYKVTPGTFQGSEEGRDAQGSSRVTNER